MKGCFHVDDCKLSHTSPKVVGKTIEWVRQEYKSIFEDRYGAISVIQGKIHRYLGMTLDYTANGISRICMMEYIDEILTAFKKWTKGSASPSIVWHHRTCSRFTRTVSKSVQTSPRYSITWEPRNYTPPRGLDLIPAH